MRNKSKLKSLSIRQTFDKLVLSTILLSLTSRITGNHFNLHIQTANDVGITPLLSGVGLFENNDQQKGIQGASLAGGTEALFRGQGFSKQAENIQAIFSNFDYRVATPGPPISKDNSFNSNTAYGRLQYTAPSAMSLFGQPYEAFDDLDSIGFQVSLIDSNPDTSVINTLPCSTWSFCQIYMQRAYTPILYQLTPRVVYDGAEFTFTVDPKSAQDFRLKGDMPFVEARIDGQTVSFENFVNEDTKLSGWNKNYVRANTYQVKPTPSAEVNLKFRVGNSLHDDSQMISCSFDNSTCYKLKVVPVINSISSNSGFTNGGQILTVKGYGFESDNIQVDINGSPCKVLSHQVDKLTCETSSSTATPTGQQYVGQQGLLRKFYNETNVISSFSSLESLTPYSQKLALSFETPVNEKDGYSANIIGGYFKPPVSANYKFYMSCDDVCQLHLSNANMTKDPASLQPIITPQGYSPYHNYFTVDGSRQSAWIPLEAGNYYYIQGQHINYGGGDHFTVSVEIDQSSPGHQNSMREAQRLSINPTNVREQSTLTINYPDGGQFTLNILIPATSKYTDAIQLNTNMSANELRNAIRSFYSNQYGAAIQVTLVMYDALEQVVSTQAESVKNVYTIQVNKALDDASIKQQPIITKVSTSSQIQFALPSGVQRSSPTLKGNFQITCYHSNGTTNQTQDIGVGNYTYQIREKIIQACPRYRDKIEVIDLPTYSYYVDGRDFLIRFASINGDIPQFLINDSPNTPLVANEATLNQSTQVPYGQSIFYEPIPFEFLHTAEDLPQVLVTVDDLPAVCAGLSCDYQYVDATASITSFSLSGLDLTIDGNNLPISTDILTLYFSNVECSVTSVTPSQILCSLSSKVAGSWLPLLTDINGLVPVDGAVSEFDVPLVVSSASPNNGLNPNGEGILTITGQNFPISLDDGSTISIEFSDGTKCLPISTTSTQIQCETQQFQSASTTLTLTLTINDVQDSSLTVIVDTSPATITEIIPSYVSPVLKSLVVLQVNNDFSGTLDIDDLSVKLVDQNITSTFFKFQNVVAVDNSAKTITFKYGGIYSGSYKISVFSKIYGKLDSSVTLQALGKVTDYSPKQGSVFGGTLITITGFNFSTVATDNPVRIGTTDCLVQTTSNTQITCLTQPRSIQSEGVDDEQLLVFLKTSEEAVCEASSDCMFTWLNSGSLPVLSSYTVDYTNDRYEVNLVGSSFPTSTSDVIFKIDGFEQTIVSATDTLINIAITEMLASTSKNIEFYLSPTGTPQGAGQLIGTGITLAPKLISISLSQGSPAGSIINAVVQGLGVKTTSAVTLTTSSGTDICAKVAIVDYQTASCQTKSLVVAFTTLKLKVGSSSYSCATCSYQTGIAFPAITSSSVSGDKLSLIITGTSFFTTGGYSAQVVFGGISADSVTIDSETQLTATWNSGVPLVSAIPEVTFESSSEKHWASSTQTISNSLSSSPALDSSVTCSFAGGCFVSISSIEGLTSTLSASNNQLTVCGKPCELSEESTSSQTLCKVPELITTYSATEYNMATADSYLLGQVFSSNPASQSALTDEENLNAYSDANAQCHFGMSFIEGHVGVVSEVKFFMKVFDRTKFVGLLSFKGSNNGNDYDTLFTVGEEIHEGWNYYDYSENNLKYRYYKFEGNGLGSCNVGEMRFRGIEAVDHSASSHQCSLSLNIEGHQPLSVTGTVTYSSTLTPVLSQISPRYGKVQGGETITFTGTGFSTNAADYSIKIDDVECEVVGSPSTTQVSCVTGSRPGLFPEPTLEFNIEGKGSVATQGLIFRYVNYWSLTATWGGEFLPVEGETVYIPKGLHLLVDVDSTPILAAVLVEGSLIFPPDEDPNHQRTFDAHYIMVKGGYMEIGTEEFPYTSKLTITMHGNKQMPELPIYGNKCIAVRHGVLEMHGVKRQPTWTELDFTADVGSTTITLREAVDWQVGEVIVIAPTSYDNHEAEERTIAAVDNSNPNKPVITLNKPLQFKHYSALETYGSDFIEMRAEVGLLTRNVIYRGDPETSSKNQFGAHIMLHSHGDESLIGRLEYVEFRDVGQAFQLGRYPIHFHLIGTVHNSYIRGNSIHHTYNRAVTIHAVHYLRVIRNVAYHTMGHTFFIEDAVETKNYLEENLAILTKASFSLLNTDQTPASFWITHPDNIFRGNHAAGSDRYGFWFDTKEHPMGPSFTPDVCPENAQLGEFSNNVAHSNGRYGLRIFHKLIPRENPCKPIVFNATNLQNPYHSNPLVTATFINFTSYKNNRNGAIAEQVGDVRFVNFKVADNLVAGIEFSLTQDTMDGTAQIYNALVIGHSNNAEELTMISSFHGVITARTENFQVHKVKFYNFDEAGMAALGSCSHCFHPASTDSGARTTTFSNLEFNNVNTRIRYQSPFRDIFYDLDGTLTERGPNTWATPYWEHNVQPECEVDRDVYDGIICDSSVQVRRIAMWNYQPNIFNGMELKILKWNDTMLSGVNKAEYLLNESAYSTIPFKQKQDPNNGWAVPYVTGHKYKIHWRYGIDFTQMQVDLSSRWTSADKNVYFVYNFTDVRARVDVITGGQTIENMTLVNKANSLLETGDNIIYNKTETREIHILYNGKNSSKNSVVIKGFRCNGPCLTDTTDVDLETGYRRWSNASSWANSKVPEFNETVEIPSGVNMLYDVQESPILNVLTINGRLTFEDQVKNVHLRSKYIFIKAGELVIGNETHPFQKTAKITLYGEKNNSHIVYDNTIEAGNKILINTGRIQMYGKPRNRMTRMVEEAYSGETTIKVEAGLDWQAGDIIGLAPSTLRYNDSDTAIITNYNAASGEITIDRALSGYHYGAPLSTAPAYNGVDMRNEVYLLTRNIRIAGEDIEAWGCQIITADYVELSGTIRNGRTYLNHVEIQNCSQYDTNKAALRWEGSARGWSEIANSAVHHGLGLGAYFAQSSNVKLLNNVFFSFVKRGINVINSENITLDGNHVSEIFERETSALDMFFEPTGAITVCADKPGDICSSISIVNNVVSGAPFTGFAAPGHKCNDYTTPLFKNNIAHSIRDTGAIIYLDVQGSSKCIEASNFAAYKCGLDGAVSYQAVDKIVFTNMTFIDNGMGGTAMIGKEGDNLQAVMNNIVMYGETEARDCFYENECNKRNHLGCRDRSGLWPAYFSKAGKDPLPDSTVKIPVHKIKSDASYGGSIVYNNLSFINFKKAKTWCGANQKAITLNTYGADYMPRAQLKKVRFENVHEDAVAFLYTPPAGWANIDDCGDFPCTAPNNMLLQFESVTYAGAIKPSILDRSAFQILPNNPEFVKGDKSCSQVPSWNGYYCENENLGVLLFENIDDDKMKRMISPIYIVNNKTNSRNTLNSFMDHIWDGFYTGQLRLSRWPSLIQTGSDAFYSIQYSGTPPGNQRFSLRADYSGVAIRIKYPKAGSYIVKDQNGRQIPPNAWDDNIKQIGALKKKECGENRFIGSENTLEFFMLAGCSLIVSPIDSIQVKVRLDWTLSAFYADGGTTAFIDRLAASLNIHASTIKVVSVYQGSVIVEFKILTEDSSTKSTIVNNLNTTLTQGKINFGAPILSSSITPVISDSNDNTNNNGNNGNNGNNNNNNNQNNNGGSKQTTIVTTLTEEESSSGNTGVIIGVVIALVLIIVLGIIGYFLIKKFKKSKLIENKTITIQSGNDANSVSLKRVPNPGEEDSYEPQYHPKVELGNIFGSRKANLADDVVEEEDRGNSIHETINLEDDSQEKESPERNSNLYSSNQRQDQTPLQVSQRTKMSQVPIQKKFSLRDNRDNDIESGKY